MQFPEKLPNLDATKAMQASREDAHKISCRMQNMHA
jgi:hypothetical protein